MSSYKGGEYVNSGGGAVYGLGFIGALVYFFSNADTFGQYAYGFVKALFWPAFLIHRVLETLGM